jgi:short-subunit dehydrogenase
MNVIVTGASSGVGYELVKKFLMHPNISLVIGIARREDRLCQLQYFATSNSCSARFISLAQDIRTLDLEDLPSDLGHVDVLVNNAGLLLNKPFESITADEFREVYEVNVIAPAMLIRRLLPVMGGDIASHVVNIGSMGGFQGSAKFAGLSAYSSSKSALAGLSECLAEELAPRNVKVNCLALGAVQTEMLNNAFPGFKAPVTAGQMADFVLGFALNGFHFFNGKVLPVSSTTP